MPLLDDLNADFIQVKTVFMASSGNYTTQGTDGQADFKYVFPSYVQNVIAIEMDDYQVPINSLSQFTDKNYIDFRLRNPSIYGGEWKQFTAVLPITAVLYNSPQVPQADILTVLYNAFTDVIGRDADFGGKVDIVPYPQATTTISLLCRTLVFPPNATWPGFGSTECEFLFASGPNSANSAATVLGFDETDYTFTDITLFGVAMKIAVSARTAQLNQYRYLDIYIDEFSTNHVFYRVFIPNVNSVANTLPEISSRARLLTRPLRQMKELNVHLRLKGGVKPSTTQTFYFNLKVYYLESSYVLPNYYKSRQQYV